jgi:plasmid maintenance system antidote protein VapI
MGDRLRFPIRPDMALRLAKYFDMSPQFWLGL